MSKGAYPTDRVGQDSLVRYFFDESALGIGRVVAGIREDAVYPGHRCCVVRPGMGDQEWIRLVAAKQWIVVCRDKKIRSRPAEAAALAAHPLRLLVLTAAGSLSVWDQLRVLLARWERIEELSRTPPPWLYTVTRNGVRERHYPGSEAPTGDARE